MESSELPQKETFSGGGKTNKLVTVGVILVTFGLLGAFIASAIINYQHPNTAVGSLKQIQEYIDGQPITSTEAIDWLTVDPNSAYVLEYDVNNTGNVAVNVIILVSSLPATWNLVWTANMTVIQPGQWANGTLTLTTGTVVPGQVYGWTTTTNLEAA